MAQQYHFHFYGGPPGPLPATGPRPPVTVISTPGDARCTRSESVHPPPRAPLPIQNRPPSRPFRAASEQVDQTGRPALTSGSEAGPAEGVDIIDDMMKYLKRFPDLCLHQLSPAFSPPARPPYRSASAGLMPPRPRPSFSFS